MVLLGQAMREQGVAEEVAMVLLVGMAVAVSTDSADLEGRHGGGGGGRSKRREEVVIHMVSRPSLKAGVAVAGLLYTCNGR